MIINLSQWKSKTKEEKKDKNIKFNSTLKEFSNYLYLEGNAKSTANAYMTDINQFNDFLKKELNNKIRYMDKITRIEIQQYKQFLLKKLENKIFAKSTVERKFNSVKVFFQFLNFQYDIQDITEGDKFGNKNFVRDWNDEYETSYSPTTITDSELNKLFNTVYNSSDKNSIRDAVILELLLSTGCRRSELLNLKWEDVDFYKNEITIRRKKVRNMGVVKINQASIQALVALKKTSSPIYSDDFIIKGRDRNSKHLSNSALNSVIKKWVTKSDINPSITPHSFRHTFITTCLREGISSEIIIKFTGHASVDALKPYIHLVPSDTINVSSVMNQIRGC